jgi:hypothetical protein
LAGECACAVDDHASVFVDHSGILESGQFGHDLHIGEQSLALPSTEQSLAQPCEQPPVRIRAFPHLRQMPREIEVEIETVVKPGGCETEDEREQRSGNADRRRKWHKGKLTKPEWKGETREVGTTPS